MNLPAPGEEGLLSQPLGIRLGLTGLILVLLGGLYASALHMAHHYENRDERPGLTLDDLEGAVELQPRFLGVVHHEIHDAVHQRVAEPF